MSTTSDCSCATFRALEAADDAFWKSPQGIIRRIDSLAQDLNYKTVNNAVKMIAPTNGAQWLHWVTSGQDNVCPRCITYSKGGHIGYYKISWFFPKYPAHPNCKCEIELVFYNPFE